MGPPATLGTPCAYFEMGPLAIRSSTGPPSSDMVRRIEVNLCSGILSRAGSGAPQGSPPPPPGLLCTHTHPQPPGAPKAPPHPLFPLCVCCGLFWGSGPWGLLGHRCPSVTSACCPLRGPIHLLPESAALRTDPMQRWSPLPCLASWAGYASPSDGTSMPPPLRSPPRPSFNMTLHPLSPSQCRPQEGKACAGCWGSLPPGLPSSEMPCSTSTAGPCHPALAVCLGRKSTGLRSGGLVLACVGSLPWPGSLAPGLQLAPSSDDAGGTGTHPEGTPTPGWQVRPAQGIWEFKVTGGPSWHAKGVLQEDGTLA